VTVKNCEDADKLANNGKEQFQKAFEDSSGAKVVHTKLEKIGCTKRRLNRNDRRLESTAGVKADFTVNKAVAVPDKNSFQKKLVEKLEAANLPSNITVKSLQDVQNPGTTQKPESPTVSAAVVAPATFFLVALWSVGMSTNVM